MQGGSAIKINASCDSIPIFSFQALEVAITATLVWEDINNSHYLCSHIAKEKQGLYGGATSSIKPNDPEKNRQDFQHLAIGTLSSKACQLFPCI